MYNCPFCLKELDGDEFKGYRCQVCPFEYGAFITNGIVDQESIIFSDKILIYNYRNNNRILKNKTVISQFNSTENIYLDLIPMNSPSFFNKIKTILLFK